MRNVPIRGQNRIRRRDCRRSILIWGLLWIAAAQIAFIAFLEYFNPSFLDPKYGCRMLALRLRREAQHNRTLLVTLGSSRTEQGFRPSLLANDSDADSPLFYNLGRGGSSPLLYLLTLRRLLADGIHPDGLLVEIFPPALVEDEQNAVIYKPTLRDWPLLRRYSVSGRTWGLWLQDRLLLWYKYRSGFLAALSPRLLPSQARWGEHLWNYRGGEWRSIGEYVSPQERRRLTDDAKHRYAHSLRHFRIATEADRALRELLALCHSQRIGVVLFLMPEAEEFRAWYPPKARRILSDYLMQLRREYDAPLIDARCWIEASEFSDSHHLLKHGAETFTRRFAGEVLTYSPRLVGGLGRTPASRGLCIPTHGGRHDAKRTITGRQK
jgi:hypothetical protein